MIPERRAAGWLLNPGYGRRANPAPRTLHTSGAPGRGPGAPEGGAQNTDTPYLANASVTGW